MNEFKLIIKPDPEEPGAAEVFVDGTIEEKPYRFLLDTGAAKSSVVFDAYTSTLTTTDKHQSSGVFAKSSNDLITLPRLEVGPISKTNVIVTRTEEGNPEVRSLIGMDLLKEFRCHFLFDENRVVVGEYFALLSDQPVQDLIFDKAFHPYLDVQFGAITAHAVWDTGASLTIVDTTFINNHPDLFQAAGSSTGTDSTGEQVETPMFIMAESVIGGSVFPPNRVASVDLSFVNATIEIPMDLILGYTMQSKANWLFDFPGKKWAISKWLADGK